MIVTRQFPNDVRTEHFIQTTPIVWLSTVAGKDNMDPAKLSLLTDYLVNFMERSHNGVVLVDGIEYLVTSNDFQKVLKAVDRWTETAMTSNCRLILSLDPRVFESEGAGPAREEQGDREARGQGEVAGLRRDGS